MTVLVSAAIAIVLISNGGLVRWLFGLWLSGIGANYLALSVYAIALRDPERLRAEVAAIPDLGGEARYYSIAQARLVIPGLVAVMAVLDSRSRS